MIHAESGETIASIAPEDGVIEYAMFARGGQSIVFEFSNHRTPGSLWEYHFGFSKVENRIDAYRKRADFFARYLNREDAKTRR